MANPELIVETHSLLKQLLELEADRREHTKDLKAKSEELKKKVDDRVAASTEGASESELEAKRKKNLEEMQQRAAEASEKEWAYREKLLAEMSKQTQLLEEIAARLRQ